MGYYMAMKRFIVVHDIAAVLFESPPHNLYLIKIEIVPIHSRHFNDESSNIVDVHNCVKVLSERR